MILMYPVPIVNDSVSSGTISSAIPKVTQIFRIPKSGTLNQLAVQLQTITTSQTMRLSLQTLDSSGNPSGTLYGGSVKGTFSPAAGVVNSVTLSTPATATQGDEVALVLEFDSTIGSVNAMTTNRYGLALGVYPYSATNNGTAWTKASTFYCMYVGYNDGTYPDIDTIPAKTATSLVFSQNILGNPDEVGIKFQMPMKAQVEGAWLYSFAANTTTVDSVKLYDTDNTTVLAQANNNQGVSPSTQGIRMLTFPTSVTLQQGLSYTLTLKSNSTTNENIYYTTFDNANAATAMHGNLGGIQTVQAASRQNSGSWTYTPTTRYHLGLLVRLAQNAGSIGASYVY